MADDSPLARRLFSRAESGGIYRRSGPGGGEVFAGPTVQRALKAIGARAMTMDDSIFVAEDFDASRPEDQALYAHERHHQLEGSGAGGLTGAHSDAEEQAARSIERMVLHRSQAGEDFGSILRDVEANGEAAAEAPSSGKTGQKMRQDGAEDEARAALAALLASGRTEDDLARELARDVLTTLSESEARTRMRTASGRLS
jgi:hypothetical protein